ncbi:MAG TPA: hypothetical protein VFK92_15365 [Burkholderiales bacterium]|nr:hypothetical protein [Burkholderiales bacterium]
MKPKNKWPGILFGTLIALFFMWLALGAPLPWDDRLPRVTRLALDLLTAITQTRPNHP